MAMDTPEDMANAFECWEWQERQAKFIVNSCRVYEFWGYDWRIPLWDSEMMDFWSRVPIELRIGKRLYDVFLRSTLFKEFHLLHPEMEKTGCKFERFVDPRHGRYHLRGFFQCSAFYQENFWSELESACPR